MTLESIVVERPDGDEKKPKHLGLDKGFDNPTGHGAAMDHGYR